MNRFLVIPIFNFLNQFNLSYGIIILVLTVAIKLLLLPMAYRNQKSSIAHAGPEARGGGRSTRSMAARMP
jgi:membrane protein insertase Oxa1/YidC/SpoIIIJ